MNNTNHELIVPQIVHSKSDIVAKPGYVAGWQFFIQGIYRYRGLIAINQFY